MIDELMKAGVIARIARVGYAPFEGDDPIEITFENGAVFNIDIGFEGATDIVVREGTLLETAYGHLRKEDSNAFAAIERDWGSEDIDLPWLVGARLTNPRRLQLSAFADSNTKGFGLMQRQRSFFDFQDLEAQYEKRPSLWVEPVGAWGEGAVHLVEIPTREEVHDNIVAYWVPANLPPPGQALDIAYRLHWQGSQTQQPPNGHVLQARRGRGWAAPKPGELQFVLDFDGPSVPPSKLGRLYLDQVGIFPGSLGNYGGVHKGVPVVTVELPNAMRTPLDSETRQMWVDLLRWVSERLGPGAR